MLSRGTSVGCAAVMQCLSSESNGCVFHVFAAGIDGQTASGNITRACWISYIETWFNFVTGTSSSTINIITLSPNWIVLDTQTAYQITAVHIADLRVSWKRVHCTHVDRICIQSSLLWINIWASFRFVSMWAKWNRKWMHNDSRRSTVIFFRSEKLFEILCVFSSNVIL